MDVRLYTLSEAWSGVNWADLMAAQGAFGTDFYFKGALGSHEIRPIHSAPSLGQSIEMISMKITHQWLLIETRES